MGVTSHKAIMSLASHVVSGMLLESTGSEWDGASGERVDARRGDEGMGHGPFRAHGGPGEFS